MNTSLLSIIESSAFGDDDKNEIKCLVQQIFEMLATNKTAVAEIYKTRPNINERQYSKRLSEPMSEEKRKEVLVHQFAHRNLFANAVLLAHEAALSLEVLVNGLKVKIAALPRDGNENNVMALVALTRFARQNVVANPDSILSEFDRVNGVAAERIFEAVQAIFESKKSGTGLFCDTSFSSSILPLVLPTAEQVKLAAVVDAAIVYRAELENLWSQYSSARSNYNVPQFNQRMEQAMTSGDTDKFAAVAAEKNDAEAALYVTATRYQNGHAKLAAISEELRSAIVAAAATVGEQKTLVARKSMSNCIGAWKWLSELTNYCERKYVGCNVPAVLATLEFDSKTYIES